MRTHPSWTNSAPHTPSNALQISTTPTETPEAVDTAETTTDDALRRVRECACSAREEGPRERFQVQEVGCHLRVRVPDSRNFALRPISQVSREGHHRPTAQAPHGENNSMRIDLPDRGPKRAGTTPSSQAGVASGLPRSSGAYAISGAPALGGRMLWLDILPPRVE